VSKKPAFEPRKWDGMLLQGMSNFFMGYAQNPNPGVFDEIMKRVVGMRLHQLAEHRHGVAGAIHGIIFTHPEMENTWKREWNHPLMALEACRPPEEDREFTNATCVDYLFMYAVTCNDILSMQRIVRLSQRDDGVGSAAMEVVNHHGQNPLMRDAVQQGTPKVQQPSGQHSIHQSVRALGLLAACDQAHSANVLYVGCQVSPEAIAVCTPNGLLPAGFPCQWEGHQVVPRAATQDEMHQWSRIKAETRRP
jgi:hypothetical protein